MDLSYIRLDINLLERLKAVKIKYVQPMLDCTDEKEASMTKDWIWWDRVDVSDKTVHDDAVDYLHGSDLYYMDS